MVLICRDLAPRVANLARLVDAEFEEMPGMRLTDAQARRLWNLTAAECDAVLQHLCEAGHLTRDETGQYVRRRFDY